MAGKGRPPIGSKFPVALDDVSLAYLTVIQKQHGLTTKANAVRFAIKFTAQGRADPLSDEESAIIDIIRDAQAKIAEVKRKAAIKRSAIKRKATGGLDKC